jgi:pyruvate dehydrogenase E1 component beta subunit
MAADFSAIITESLFQELKSPVIRVIPPHTPVPFSGPLEDEWVPNADKIVAGIRKSLEY